MWMTRPLVPRVKRSRREASLRLATLVTSGFLAPLLIASGWAQAPDGGPYQHQVLSASSPDGLNWTFDGRVLLEHASVPAAIVTPDGALRIYYVDASQMPENVNCAESRDGGQTFRVLGCTIAGRAGVKAVDPSIALLPDGRYRLYYYASQQDPGASGLHAIHSAISSDGVGFAEEGEAFSYPGLVDPDVFWTGEEWLMYVFSLDAHATLIASSRDGLSFQYVGPLPLKDWGTTAPVRLDDGQFRLYAFDQPRGQTVASFLSHDGFTWSQEDGVRLTAPAGQQITDPFVVRLPDGSWKMILKTSRDTQP